MRFYMTGKKELKLYMIQKYEDEMIDWQINA